MIYLVLMTFITVLVIGWRSFEKAACAGLSDFETLDVVIGE